jgi:Big-like domain-containing protein
MRARSLAVVFFTAATVGTCVFPTERDASVHVSITPIGILFRGNDTVAMAQAWQMLGPADSQPIPNAVFTWSSSDPSVATVDDAGHIVGVNSGTVIITAAAANFDKRARAASDTVRVAAPLDIDSIRPKIVQYGEMLSIYGVGVTSILVARLKDAELIRVPYADTQFAGGTERSKWWVPFPAHTDTLFFLGISGTSGVFGYFPDDTTTVIEQDLFEPDDSVPRVIDLDAPPSSPLAPTLVFSNPALAFEPLLRGAKTGADWYRFTHAQTKDLTFVLTAPQIAGSFVTYLTDSLGWNGATQQFFIGKNAWTFGPGSHACHGLGFAPGEALGDSTIVAFKALPSGTLDAIAIYGAPGRYGLSVIAGYQSEIPPDAHEDDNSCNIADLRPIKGVPFRDTLAIQNPHDMDWIRFTVTSGSTHRFRLHAFTGVHPDSLKDLDLYVIRVPNPVDVALQIMMADSANGSDVNRTVFLSAGSYYAVVVDYAGTTTRYEICVASGLCPTPFPTPPASPPANGKAASRTVAAPAFRLAPGRSP